MQNEIETILNSTEYDDVIIGCDSNWDKVRQSGFSVSMERWVNRIGLVDLWNEFPGVQCTHLHTDLSSMSTLDRFFVNERLVQYIESAGVLHLADNPSRHSPIMLRLKVGEIKKREEVNVIPPRRPAWAKASQDNKEDYTNILHEKLSSLVRPESLNCQDPHCQDQEHKAERDSYVLDVMTAMIESSHQGIPLSGGKKNNSNPRQNCPVDKCVPGWKEEIAPFKEDALFWHSVWQSAGSPSKGVLRDIMARTRNKYHYAIRRVRRQSKNIRAANLLAAANTGDIDLLKEMKRVKGSSKGGQTLPDSVDGAQGHDEILDKFKEVYQTLYNSAETVDAMTELKRQLSGMIGHDSVTEVNKITSDVVKEACCRMKPGKMDVSGSYTSDVFLNAPDSLFEVIAPVFRSFLVHGDVTLQLLTCAFLPLFKGGLKDPGKSDSCLLYTSPSPRD